MANVRPAALPVAVLLSLACSLGSCRRKDPAPAAAADEVVAEMDGERITMTELDRRVLQRVEQSRLYEMRKQVLDEMLAERLLAQEAKLRGTTREALLKAEVEGKVAPVREEEVKASFERSGLARRGATLQMFHEQIERSLRERRTAERRVAFMDELRRKARVKVVMEEPRTTLALPPDAPALGPEKAPVTMVEFLDYQCPYCHQVQGMVDEVLAKYPGQVRFVHRDFPLEGIHPQAMKLARAARCAGEQGKFWEYHRRLLTEQGHEDADLQRQASALGLDGARFSTCVASDRHDAQIQKAAAQGREAGVSGTPTFFINGRRLVGVRPAEEVKKVIDEELKRGQG
jgi:protein-disulfide isomerase